MRRAKAIKRTRAAQLHKVAEKKATYTTMSPQELETEILQLEKEMYDAAQNLEFEKAAELRDKIHTLREQFIANS